MTGALWLLLAVHATAGPLRDSVMTLLAAYEAPVTAEAIQALGPEVRAELIAIADDASVPPTRRARALTGLQHVERNQEVARAFRRHLDSEVSLIRRHAALSMAVLGDDAVDALERSLAASDVELRLATVQSLARIGTPKARAALSARRSVESEARVLKALDDAGVAP